MYLTQCIKRNAQTNSNGIATIFGNRTRTWSELLDRVAKLAGAIKTRCGGNNARVAILALNSDRYFEYYFATWWAGAVVVPMNIRWSVAEHAYSLNDSGATTLFVDDNFIHMIDDIRKQASALTTVIYMGDNSDSHGTLNYEQLIESSEPMDDAWRGGEDLAGLFYTGGTTGFPKGVMLPHRALWASSISIAWHGKLTADSRLLNAAPMFHLADMALGLASTIGGASHVFISAFDAEKTVQAIQAHDVSIGLLVPTMIKMTVDHLQEDKNISLTSLRQVFFGASPMPRALLENAINLLPDVGWSQLYGQTELAPLATFQPAEYCTTLGKQAEKLNSAGQAGLCVELQIVDELGAEVERGQVGEIRVRGANVMQGYWNRPEETAVTLVNGWVNTGDAGYMDNDGFLFIADRLKDMIITGGENVFSAEVESALSTHAGVSECAVIGIPSEQWGEAVHAIIICTAGNKVTEQALIAHCRAQIAHYKCPSSITFRTDPMPLSGAGKVLKRDLRVPFWAGKERQVN